MRPSFLVSAVSGACLLTVAAPAAAYDAVGTASWYGAQHHGKRTASGERFNMNEITAAHRTLPLGSVLEVTNLANDKTVKVRVNDRGPYSGGRILDVSKAAADRLGFISQGTARVRVRTLGAGDAVEVGEPEEAPPPLPAAPVSYAALTKSPPAAQVAPPVLEEAAVAPEVFAGTRVVPLEAPGFAVQAGTFAVRENAERTAERLRDLGAVDIRTIQRGAKTFHVVLVGAWPARTEAEGALPDFAKAGFADARVVSAF